jgi:hypothetical protein
MSENSAGSTVVAIFGSLTFLSVIAVTVSQKAETAKVIKALGGAVGMSIGAAVSPLNSTTTNSTNPASPDGYQ